MEGFRRLPGASWGGPEGLRRPKTIIGRLLRASWGKKLIDFILPGGCRERPGGVPESLPKAFFEGTFRAAPPEAEKVLMTLTIRHVEDRSPVNL